ncbi:HAT2 [Auxenochlorella protothecoides x Auxenochlorella symbiontica]
MTTDPPSKRGRSEAVTHDANEVIELVFDVGMESEEQAYNPDMCHQLFGEEELIQGHPEPAITLKLSAAFHALLEVDSGGKKEPGATDVVGPFKEAFGDALFTDEEAFQRAAVQEGSLDVANLGTPVSIPGDWAPECAGGELSLQLLASSIASATPQLKALHARLQPLLLFYIDAASMIDQDDDSWDLILALAKTPGGQRVAGFATLYSFFGWPDSKRMRLSQVFVLPAFQKRGVGRALLAAATVHAQAAGALDMTCEDPTEDLQRLRDRLDVQRARHAPWLLDAARRVSGLPPGATTALEGKGEVGEGQAAFHTTIPADITKRARQELCLCKQQAQRVWEVLLYEFLRDAKGQDGADRAMQQAIRQKLSTAISAAETGSKGKVTQETESGFILHKRRRRDAGPGVGGRPGNPCVPVEEGSAEAKAAAVEQAVEARLDAIASVAQRRGSTLA